jgi:hypothetical protein
LIGAYDVVEGDVVADCVCEAVDSVVKGAVGVSWTWGWDGRGVDDVGADSYDVVG